MAEKRLGVLQRRILTLLQNDPEDVRRTTAEIAMKFRLGRGQALQSLTKLRRRGLVKRNQHPDHIYDVKPVYQWRAVRDGG